MIHPNSNIHIYKNLVEIVVSQEHIYIHNTPNIIIILFENPEREHYCRWIFFITTHHGKT